MRVSSEVVWYLAYQDGPISYGEDNCFGTLDEAQTALQRLRSQTPGLYNDVCVMTRLIRRAPAPTPPQEELDATLIKMVSDELHRMSNKRDTKRRDAYVMDTGADLLVSMAAMLGVKL